MDTKKRPRRPSSRSCGTHEEALVSARVGCEPKGPKDAAWARVSDGALVRVATRPEAPKTRRRGPGCRANTRSQPLNGSSRQPQLCLARDWMRRQARHSSRLFHGWPLARSLVERHAATAAPARRRCVHSCLRLPLRAPIRTYDMHVHRQMRVDGHGHAAPLPAGEWWAYECARAREHGHEYGGNVTRNVNS